MRKTGINLLRTAVCVGFVIWQTACNGTGEQVSSRLPQVVDAQAVTPEKNISGTPMNLSEQIQFSKRDLARNRSIELNSIAVTGARQVNWRSGALGCPQPGMNYTQALVPGVLIHLKVDKEIIAYHAMKDGKPFYCPWDRAEAPVYDKDSDLI